MLHIYLFPTVIWFAHKDTFTKAVYPMWLVKKALPQQELA